MKMVRCAIYTRKSSEEGLEQDFNSLDAQREACAAYILSQASEGWTLLGGHYDDGGLSGGTLERPALQRLLADVSAGKVDIIVVYKVDRLTRSLLDFSKLVETFDTAGVSFVSVTQAFNTTTSMGRLTLNMLLSFAQFEREVTAERIRDKIAASKARGMWMGGTPPLGYRPEGRSLAIVEPHAALVCDIFARYLALGNVRLVVEALDTEGIRSPPRISGKGRRFGDRPFSRGQVHAMLKNPLYIGEVHHKGQVYAGQHTAIIDRETWEAVQQRLNAHSRGERRTRLPNRSLLAGLIVDAHGEAMLAAHACKGKVRYRYYVSRVLQAGAGQDGQRLPAREIEAVVAEHAARLFDDPILLAAQLGLTITPRLLPQISAASHQLAATLRDRTHRAVRDVVERVQAFPDRLEVRLGRDKIVQRLGLETDAPAHQPLILTIPFRLTRTGRAVRLVQEDGSRSQQGIADPALVRLLIQARRWWGILAEGEMGITALAEREGVNPSYITRIVRVAFLAPAVVDAILSGRQHGELDAARLRQTDAVPALWAEQMRLFLPA